MTNFQLYLASILPLLIVIITCIARVNDIGRTSKELRWHFRRLGFVFVGGASGWMLLSPMWDFAYVGESGLTFLIGQSMVWVTTPNMPPWWRYITGEFRQVVKDSPAQNIFDKTAGRETGAHPIVPTAPIIREGDTDLEGALKRNNRGREYLDD